MIAKRRTSPLAQYSVGPKTAFQKNRVALALLKYRVAKGGGFAPKPDPDPVPAVVELNNVEPYKPEDPPHIAEAPRYRSLGDVINKQHNDANSEDDEDDDDAITVSYPNRRNPAWAIKTVKGVSDDSAREDDVLLAHAELANAELEKTVARDTTRDEIGRYLKGLHLRKSRTRVEMSTSVVIFLMQRGYPRPAIDALTSSIYHLFDVKCLYYGNFENLPVRVKVNGELVDATIVAYHAFDGFRAVYKHDNGKSIEVGITNNTRWEWPLPKASSG